MSEVGLIYKKLILFLKEVKMSNQPFCPCAPDRTGPGTGSHNYKIIEKRKGKLQNSKDAEYWNESTAEPRTWKTDVEKCIYCGHVR